MSDSEYTPGSKKPANEADAVAYLPLVQNVARRLARRLPGHIELDDLISAGVVGLMEALGRYDPSRAAVFRPYATTRIRGAMLDELRRRDLMARDARSTAKRLAKAAVDLYALLGRSPEDEELAAHVGLSPDELLDTLNKVTPVAVISLQDANAVEVRCGDMATDELASAKQMQGLLAENIARLPKRTQDILHLYYTIDLTLAEVGEVVGVSESRISQIITRATLELQAMMAEPSVFHHRGTLGPKEQA